MRRTTSVSRATLATLTIVAIFIVLVGGNESHAQSATTTTAACTAPGVTCGNFELTWAQLVTPGQGKNGTLIVTDKNNSTGNGNTTEISYYINGKFLSTSQAVPLGVTQNFTLLVPVSFGITAENDYTISARTTIDKSGVGSQITVTAIAAPEVPEFPSPYALPIVITLAIGISAGIFTLMKRHGELFSSSGQKVHRTLEGG